ncbi:MAG: hypothetical protein KA243_06520 [Candidatus Aminicenantes bacterium]|jgi:hypothetical protein|nr:hypothetical protein [Candidatus Aminicenantes bacterium]NLH76391.1 hypothetical protein [Acidobacteriota bacterium]
MKRSLSAVLACAALALAVLPACKTMSSDELKGSIEIVDYVSVWVDKYYQPWPQRLILVPQISFRVKNVGAKPLTYVNFNAVYQFKGDPENFGDAFMAAIRGKAIPPGGTSDVIVLKSNLGVEGKNLAGIRDNPEWKQAFVRLFAISKGSTPVLLGVYDVSRDIAFKEPEPVEPKK